MEGFKGTPGKWAVGMEGEILSDAGYIVMGTDLVHGNENDLELIASAPELLEALQEMVAIVKKHTYPQPDKPSSTWGQMEAAEAVIAKALGQ
ncbi:hypothetical protein [Pantoea sp. WEP]|uniref:hypothetical protein n=1 Tax=Pantoea sp. WEP TaxID=3230025 RepID=UPI0035614C62